MSVKELKTRLTKLSLAQHDMDGGSVYHARGGKKHSGISIKDLEKVGKAINSLAKQTHAISEVVSLANPIAGKVVRATGYGRKKKHSDGSSVASSRKSSRSRASSRGSHRSRASSRASSHRSRGKSSRGGKQVSIRLPRHAFDRGIRGRGKEDSGTQTDDDDGSSVGTQTSYEERKVKPKKSERAKQHSRNVERGVALRKKQSKVHAEPSSYVKVPIKYEETNVRHSKKFLEESYAKTHPGWEPPARKTNAYAQYVKKHYDSVRKMIDREMPNATPTQQSRETISEIAAMWKSRK